MLGSTSTADEESVVYPQTAAEGDGRCRAAESPQYAGAEERAHRGTASATTPTASAKREGRRRNSQAATAGSDRNATDKRSMGVKMEPPATARPAEGGNW